MLAQIKLYGTIALALALIGMGFWFKGVLAERTALKLQVTSLQSSIVTRDATISQLNKGHPGDERSPRQDGPGEEGHRR